VSGLKFIKYGWGAVLLLTVPVFLYLFLFTTKIGFEDTLKLGSAENQYSLEDSAGNLLKSGSLSEFYGCMKMYENNLEREVRRYQKSDYENGTYNLVVDGVIFTLSVTGGRAHSIHASISSKKRMQSPLRSLDCSLNLLD